MPPLNKENWKEENACSDFSHSEKCSGVHIGAHCLTSKDVRGAIVGLTSRMLDNPDKNRIYPTTRFYNDLELYIEKLLASQESQVRKDEVMKFMREIQDRANTVRPNLLLNEVVNYAYDRMDKIALSIEQGNK